MSRSLSFMLALTFMSALVDAKPSRSPKVYAHRGLRATHPENTMPGYQAALRAGSHFVDLDIVFTKDGEVLVSHDPILNSDIVRDQDGKFIAESKQTLAAMTAEERQAYNRKFAVKNMTFAITQRFDVGRINPQSKYASYFPEQIAIDGTRMPTMREVIRYVKETAGQNVGFQIEVKTDPTNLEISADPEIFAKAIHKILVEENVVELCEIQAFDFRVLTELQKIDGRIKTAYLTSRDNERGGVDDFFSADKEVATRWTGRDLREFATLPQMVKAMGGHLWEPEDWQLTRESLAEAHSLGLKVVVWSWPEQLGTAFDPELVQRMIDWGVDGIITDDPARLNNMLRQQGYPVPASFGGHRAVSCESLFVGR